VETGLDYFAARYFSSAQGRWTTPDWSARAESIPYADLSNPQTLNLYGYVANNPLFASDPEGHGCKADAGGDTSKWLACNGVAKEISGYEPFNVERLVKGAAKGLANDFIGATNLVDSMRQAIDGGPDLRQPLLEASNQGEARGMMIGFLAAMLTGVGEEAAGEELAAGVSDEVAPALAEFAKGGKTSGVLRTASGDAELLSGWEGPASSMPKGSPGFDIITRTHVEGHAAALMRQQGAMDGRLFINNPVICSNCSKLLPSMLPSGVSLRVVLPDGSVVPFKGLP